MINVTHDQNGILALLVLQYMDDVSARNVDIVKIWATFACGFA